MVRPPRSLDGIVADPCLLLLAVEHEHRGVHVEDHARGWPREQHHAVKQAVMQGAQLPKSTWSHPNQKPAQRRCVGITR